MILYSERGGSGWRGRKRRLKRFLKKNKGQRRKYLDAMGIDLPRGHVLRKMRAWL